jgi:hypothetical protein
MLSVKEICQEPEGHVDTAEQAALRACLVHVLEEHDPLGRIRVGKDLIELMRDQLMGLASRVRNLAALEARETMTPAQIVIGSGFSAATVSRLLSKGREVQ